MKQAAPIASRGAMCAKPISWLRVAALLGPHAPGQHLLDLACSSAPRASRRASASTASVPGLRRSSRTPPANRMHHARSGSAASRIRSAMCASRAAASASAPRRSRRSGQLALAASRCSSAGHRAVRCRVPGGAGRPVRRVPGEPPSAVGSPRPRCAGRRRSAAAGRRACVAGRDVRPPERGQRRPRGRRRRPQTAGGTIARRRVSRYAEHVVHRLPGSSQQRVRRPSSASAVARARRVASSR